jgi:hypothetical protein
VHSSTNIKRTVEETKGTRNARKGKIFQTLINKKYIRLSVEKTAISTEKRLGLTRLRNKIKRIRSYYLFSILDSCRFNATDISFNRVSLYYNSNSIIMENSEGHGKTQSRTFNHEKYGKHRKIMPIFILFHVFCTFNGLPFRLNYSASLN